MNTTLVRCCIVFALLCTSMKTAVVNQEQDIANIEGRKPGIADLLFPRDTESQLYFVKLICRFSDPDSQINLTVYPGGHSALTRYSLQNSGSKSLADIIADALRHNSTASDRDIASGVEVKKEHFQIELRQIDDLLKDLKSIRISPFFQTRVVVDNVHQYDYWFQSDQESVRYTLYGPFKQDQQDKLVQWMIRFRLAVDKLSRERTSTTQSKQ